MEEQNRYLQLYDKDGLALLGTDGIYRFDNRLNNANAILAYSKQVKRQYHKWESDNSYIKPRAKYCKVMQGRRNPKIIMGTVILHDLF